MHLPQVVIQEKP